MSKLLMITFRCREELFDRLEKFAESRNIDRTSAVKLALHYYLNVHANPTPVPPPDYIE